MTPFEKGLLHMLRRIANALDRLVAEADPIAEGHAPEPDAPTCQHPAEKRMQFGGMQGAEEWECGVCGHHEPAPEPVGAEA